MKWHNKTRDYWEFIATEDKHSMSFQIHDLVDFDESTLRALSDELIKYVSLISELESRKNQSSSGKVRNP